MTLKDFLSHPAPWVIGGIVSILALIHWQTEPVDAQRPVALIQTAEPGATQDSEQAAPIAREMKLLGDTIPAWAMVGLTSAIVFLVWRTLEETRLMVVAAQITQRAAEDSVKAAQTANAATVSLFQLSRERQIKEVRPFISFTASDVHFLGLVNDNKTKKLDGKFKIKFSGSLKNWGTVPANNVVLLSKIVFCKSSEVADKGFMNELKVAEKIENNLPPIFPGQDGSVGISQLVDLDQDEIVLGNGVILIFVHIRYGTSADDMYLTQSVNVTENLMAFAKNLKMTGNATNLNLLSVDGQCSVN